MDRRASYFNCIEEKLSTLSFRISQRGKLNLQDFNILAEDFYALLLNLVYGYSLTNINATRHNAEAIDLIDDTSKRLVQVSSVATKTKIQDALDKSSLNNYKGYTFMFMSISKDASNLRKSSYTVPTEVNFSPLHDILDVTSVLSTVKSFDTAKTYKVYQLIQRELGSDVPLDKLDSDLTQIINTLFDMNSDVDIELTQSQTYNIDKKID